jgi:predicted metal-dependent hydrolase
MSQEMDNPSATPDSLGSTPDARAAAADVPERDAHKIEVRNLRFPLNPSMPRYWLGGNRVMSLFLDHLSMVFPPGERFFMQSVRTYDTKVKDPQLKEAMRAFHAQEALHGREHASYNELLRGRGYPVDAIDRSAKGILGLSERLLPKSWQLAATAALEHFTAMLAQFLLSNDSVLEGAPPEMAAMWRWHAAEENEHSAVAFDVFRVVGGPRAYRYFTRVIVMVFTTLFFWLKMVEHQVRMMHADGCLLHGKEWLALGKFAFRKPGVFPLLWRAYFAYFKPSFHPHQLDCSPLLERWKSDFETSPVYRESLFVPGAAKRAPLVEGRPVPT